MTGIDHWSRSGNRATVLVLPFVVALVVGCADKARPQAETQRTADTPAAVAPFSMPIDSLPVDSILAYARMLPYDTLYGVGDEQRIGEGQCTDDCKTGPRIALQPQQQSFSTDRDGLAKGRIVARMINRDTLSVAAFNVASRDTTYWWVDSTAAGWRSVLISSAPGTGTVTRKLLVEDHANRRYSQSLARWIVQEEGAAGPWVVCSWASCCKVQ